jgi:hypothetical protein
MRTIVALPLRATSSGTHDSYGKLASAAVETGLDWLIQTVGNESAAREVKEKWREKGGLVMPTSGGYS